MDRSTPLVAIVMGSRSDWPTLKCAADALDALEVAWEARVVSAHRTPDRLVAFSRGAKGEGFKVIIAGAGGALHGGPVRTAAHHDGDQGRRAVHEPSDVKETAGL